MVGLRSFSTIFGELSAYRDMYKVEPLPGYNCYYHGMSP
jgi:hypothetical protein